jgi:hypothetical protein
MVYVRLIELQMVEFMGACNCSSDILSTIYTNIIVLCTHCKSKFKTSMVMKSFYPSECIKNRCDFVCSGNES